jgi:hypothetical protein
MRGLLTGSPQLVSRVKPLSNPHMAKPRLTSYEKQQLESLRGWMAQPPGWLTRGLSQASGPVAQFAQRLVPVAALKLALSGANTLAARLADEQAVLRDAGAGTLQELRAADLSRCDALSERVRRQAIGLSAAGGVIAGVAGAPGLVLDVPALLTLSLHTIHRTGLCYGFESLSDGERPFAIGVFALASANTMEEKQSALQALRQQAEPDEGAFRDGLERAAQRELGKSAAVFSLGNLARQLGLNLTRRKAAAAVPLLGAVVGGAVNGWYLHDLARTARFAFHARRFAEQGHL